MGLFRQFENREEAGDKLAAVLEEMDLSDPVILALPRGGVPVAAKVATALKAPLDLVLVRKIGVPFQPELALAAVVDGGDPEIVINDEIARMTSITKSDINELARTEFDEIERRRALYLENQPHVKLEGKTLVIVDDGIATGATVKAAIHALKRKNPKGLIVAVPVAPTETIKNLESEVTNIVCLKTPEPFLAIGRHYREFHQLCDEEVISIMKRHQGTTQ